jgi:hypothetical protein
MIANTTTVATRIVTPLVRLAAYASKAAANWHLNRFALYIKFDSESVNNSEQNDNRSGTNGAHNELSSSLRVQTIHIRF